MTTIKRITIHGFKSFANRTDIPFQDNFNCILGPNGSGKSNIGDAICFVLGRLSAKSMRAEKAANLIFNGGKNKKPSSAGMVEMVFDNQNKCFPVEANDISINRTITKKGNSIYRINGKKKTRTEVLDLLSLAKINPEGYNIILQGDITRFVDMSPLERRQIIEEISDVSIYEEKKHKAILELNSVDEKLNNAGIILTERKTYLKELKKDRDQALKFKELKDHIDSNKATYLHLQIKDKEELKSKYDAEIAKYKQELDNFESKIGKIKDSITKHKEEIKGINQHIEQRGEKEQLNVHRQIEDLKVKLAEDRTRISTLKDEINKIKQRKDQFEIEIKELEEKFVSQLQLQKDIQQNLQRKNKERQDWENSILQFKKKHKIESSQEIEKEIEEKDRLIEQKQEEVQKIRQQQQESVREKDKVEYQLGSVDERIKKVKEVEQQNKEQVKELQKFKDEFKSSTLRLNKCLEEDSSFASQLANARRKLLTVQEKHAKLNAEAMTIQMGISSNKAVQNILENKNKFTGVYGTIAELGQVNKKYTRALESAAGSKMQDIVVDNDKIAADCIKYLKNNKLGFASFIPLNKIKYHEITADDKEFLKQSGVHDFALNLISFKPKYSKAFAHIFGKTIVVEDIDTARAVGIGKIKMAALDGNIAEASGVMRGGFVSRNVAGFKDKDFQLEIEELDKEISELQQIIAVVEKHREANMGEISHLRNRKAELEAEVIKLEKILHLDAYDLEASTDLKKEFQVRMTELNSNLSSMQATISKINQELASLKSQKQLLKSEISQLRDPRLLAQLSAFEESKQKCREDILHLENELKNATSNIHQLIAPERDKIREIIKQQQKEEEKFQTEIKELTVSISKKEKELVATEKESKEFYSKYKELFNKREKLSNEVNTADSEIENIREKSRRAEREINLISLKNAEVKAKFAGLQEEFSKYKNNEILKNKSIEELKQEISKFEVMLAQMSAVNLKALEIYEQVEREFNKLIEKKSSLEKEKVDVLTLMNEIEAKKKEHFMKTFDKANENFQRVFSSLLQKGKAYLHLENKEQPFEDGLTIKVQIPGKGKRLMDIKSLSGGEKTLTALSFIFAIQEYQPASFYIFDEIDATLDKHNSEVLSKLINNYAGRAQYIVISHNDAVISEADTLYGLSMKEGVSKVTSLKI